MTELLIRPTSSKWLTEQTIKIFLDYYCSMDWIRNYLLEIRCFLQAIGSAQYPEFETNLLLLRKLLFTTTPTAKGLNELMYSIQFNYKEYNEAETRVDEMFQPHKSKNNYFDKIRYFLYFDRKAIGANHAGHPTLSALWKELSMKKINTPSAWLVYATVRCEKSRIMGYEEDVMYWKEMKENRPKRVTDFASNILSISKYNEKKANEEEWVKDYKSREEEARLQGNTEQAECWNFAADHVKDKDCSDQARNFSFLAAWCITKATKPNQEIPTVWRAAAHFFRQTVEDNNTFNENIKKANHLFRIAIGVTMTIKEWRAYSLSLPNIAGDTPANPELVDLLTQATIHIDKKIEFMKNLAVIENNDYASLERNMKLLNIASGETKDLNSIIIEFSKHLNQARSLVVYVTKLLEIGYAESSQVILQQIPNYRNHVKGYFNNVLLSERMQWNPLSNYEILITQSQLGRQKIESTRYFNLFSNIYCPYLEKIIRIVQFTSLSIQNSNSTDVQIAQFLLTFSQRVLNVADEYFYDEYSYGHKAISSILNDYDKVIKYEELAQKNANAADNEAAELFRMKAKFRLRTAELQQMIYMNGNAKVQSKTNDYLRKAERTIRQTEILIKMAIHVRLLIPKNISKVQKLEQAADIYYLAATSPNHQHITIADRLVEEAKS